MILTLIFKFKCSNEKLAIDSLHGCCSCPSRLLLFSFTHCFVSNACFK